MKNILFFIPLFFFINAGILRVPAQDRVPDEAQTIEKQEEETPPKYEVQLNFSSERLTRDLGVWRTASVYVQRKFADRQLVWANYRVSERGGARDQEFVAGLYKPFSKKWALTAEAMYSPTRRYVGSFSVMGEAERILKRGFVAHFGGRFTNYKTVKATTGYGLVEKYWGSNRAAYTLYVTKLTAAGTAPTHRVQYNRYFGERVNSVGVAASFGREHENLGPNLGILRSATWSVSLSGKYWLTDKLGLNVDGTLHRQGTLYYRRGLSFGLRYRF